VPVFRALAKCAQTQCGWCITFSTTVPGLCSPPFHAISAPPAVARFVVALRYLSNLEACRVVWPTAQSSEETAPSQFSPKRSPGFGNRAVTRTSFRDYRLGREASSPGKFLFPTSFPTAEFIDMAKSHGVYIPEYAQTAKLHICRLPVRFSLGQPGCGGEVSASSRNMTASPLSPPLARSPAGGPAQHDQVRRPGPGFDLQVFGQNNHLGVIPTCWVNTRTRTGNVPECPNR